MSLAGLRGRTRPGRLALLDRLLLARERELLARTDGAFAHAVFVDVGLGDAPDTTFESARAFRQVAPGLATIGVDIDPVRVAHARARYEPQVELRLGSFALPLTAGEPARLVRAMNVLRNYPEDEVPEIHAQLCAALLPGGLCVEGSSSRAAGNLCAHLIRRHPDGPRREALCFATDFRQGFAPRMFRDCLPRDLRRHVRHGEAIGELLGAWQSAFERARAGQRRAPAQLFDESVRELAARLPSGALELRWLQSGYVLWHPDHASLHA